MQEKVQGQVQGQMVHHESAEEQPRARGGLCRRLDLRSRLRLVELLRPGAGGSTEARQLLGDEGLTREEAEAAVEEVEEAIRLKKMQGIITEAEAARWHLI